MKLFLPDYTILCSGQSKRGQRGTKRTKKKKTDQSQKWEGNKLDVVSGTAH